MRIKALVLILIFGFGSAFAQQMTCNDRAKKWQQLLMEYKFAEMDALVTSGIKVCSVESYFEIHHQAALTYLWRGKLDQAKPIIEKLSERAKKNVQSSRGATAFGPSNYLPFMLAVYSKSGEKVEEYMASYETSIFKFQEQALIYLLRTGDLRFESFYLSRKPTKWEYVPILCHVWCKRNEKATGCPCGSEQVPSPPGGPYAVYKDYLNGKPLDQIRKDVETKFAEAPYLKREVMECLGIK